MGDIWYLVQQAGCSSIESVCLPLNPHYCSRNWTPFCRHGSLLSLIKRTIVGVNACFVMTALWAEGFKACFDEDCTEVCYPLFFQCVIHGLYDALIDAQQTQNPKQKGGCTHGYGGKHEKRKAD